MRILRLLLSLLPILTVFQLLIIPRGAHALTFAPTFSVSPADITPGANSNVSFAISQPAGDEVLSSVAFSIPAGWDVARGSSFAQNAILATGSFTSVDAGFGVPVTSAVEFRNDTDLQGHKAHWKIAFISPFVPEIVLETFLDGDVATGHTFRVQRAFLANIETPLDLTFTLNGSVGGVPLLTNPTTQGDYQWRALFTSPSSTVVSRSLNISMLGSLTPIGAGVTVSLSDGTSVTFSAVTEQGITTITTSATAPDPGGGQFRVGGLYYDFDSTATFACPCIVTLPYNPDLIADPKIYHQEMSIWVDVTTNVDILNRTVTGIVSSFSFFAAGEPNFGLEFMDPVAAMLQESDPIVVSGNRTLPVNFTLADSNNDYIVRDDVSVQVVDTADNVLVGELGAEALTKHYKANLSVGSLSLDAAKTYRMRVKVDNTAYSPTLLFNIR